MAKRNETALSRKNQIKSLLNTDQFKESLADVLWSGFTHKKLVDLAVYAVSLNPKVAECDPISICSSVRTAGELGLSCTGMLGEGYLVPYKGVCKFIPGYRGMINLMRRSGQIVRIESRLVYENDTFQIEYGLQPKLEHKPCLRGHRGDILCVYAIAELKDGSRQVEVMTISEVEAIRDRSSFPSGPWKEHFGEMARKTVIRRIAKYLPLTIEVAKAERADNEQYPQGVIDGLTGLAAAAGVDGCKERIKNATKKVESTQIDPEPSNELNEAEQQAFDENREAQKAALQEPNANPNPEPEKPENEEPAAMPKPWRCLDKGHEFDFPDGKEKNKCPICFTTLIKLIADIEGK